jgi:hypothetical protein
MPKRRAMSAPEGAPSYAGPSRLRPGSDRPFARAACRRQAMSASPHMPRVNVMHRAPLATAWICGSRKSGPHLNTPHLAPQARVQARQRRGDGGLALARGGRGDEQGGAGEGRRIAHGMPVLSIEMVWVGVLIRSERGWVVALSRTLLSRYSPRSYTRLRHPRASGDPGAWEQSTALDPRLRGGDGACVGWR